nr:ATPase, T2SS/T4P/T4SS family [uncultured Rhodopila sp.]
MSAAEAARQLRYLLKPLDRWRFERDVNDLCINRPGELFVRRKGGWEQHEVPLDYDDVYDIAVLAGAINQQNVNDSKPLVAAELPDGERLQAVLPPCVPSGTCSLTLRVHETSVVPIEQAVGRYNTERWNQWAKRREARKADYAKVLALYDSGDLAGCFNEIVRLRFNPVLCGATGAGKTTFLNTLISVIKPNERIITIENALEIQIVNQPNHVRFLYSHGDQSVAKVTQKQLLEAYLRSRPDRGCVGELRDPEATYTYVAEAMTGHPGSPSTIHGKDASQAAVRLFNLFQASEAGRSFTPEMIKAQLGMAVDMIIPFREHEGRYEIGEVWLAAEAERRGEDFRELLEAP